MKAKAILTSLVLCLFTAAVALAADSFLGTWKLNEGKSKLNPSIGKNSTVVYEAVGDDIKVTIDGTGPDGKAVHDEWTGKFDGKDYPVTGNPAADTRAYRKIDDHKMETINKKDGKAVLTAQVEI